MTKFYSTLRKVALAGAAAFLSLTATAQVKVQFIHNAADPALATVDIYNMESGQLIRQNLGFRQATAYIDFADSAIEVGIAHAGSSSHNEAFLTKQWTLNNGSSNVAVFAGVQNPANFQANPHGLSIAADLYLRQDITEADQATHLLPFYWFQGATDMAKVFPLAYLQQPIWLDSARYGEYGPRRWNITTQAAPGAGGVPIQVDLFSGLSGQAVNLNRRFIVNLAPFYRKTGVILVSGFLDTASNGNAAGRRLALITVDADGNVTPATEIRNAAIQFVHNSPDPAVGDVSIWVNHQQVKDNLGFRQAHTANVDATAPVHIAVVKGTADTLLSGNIGLAPGIRQTGVITGVRDPSNFMQNPQSANIQLGLSLLGNRAAAAQGTAVNYFITHGVTDMGQVRVENMATAQADFDGGFRQASPQWITRTTANDVQFEVINPGVGAIGRFTATLSTWNGQAGIIMLSGFRNPDLNQNGPAMVAMGVNGANDQVTIYQISPVVSMPDMLPSNLSLYPNPASDQLFFNYSLEKSGVVNIRIMDVNGKVVATEAKGQLPAGDNQGNISVANFASGVYMLQIQAGNEQINQRFVVK